MVCEGERQPEHPGELRAEPAGAEQPDRRHVAPAGHRHDARPRLRPFEQPDQVIELLREGLGGQPFHRAAQRQGRELVGPRCAADPEIDPARVQGLQRAELLRHHQRSVVGQHHAAGTDPDR